LLDHHESTLVSGKGLIPLIGSRVLERIHLSRPEETGGIGLDDKTVSNILSTIIPYKLDFVDFNGSSSDPSTLPFEWGGFMIRFALEKARRLVDCRAKCDHCDRQISDLISTTTVLENVSRLTDCYICRKQQL